MTRYKTQKLVILHGRTAYPRLEQFARGGSIATQHRHEQSWIHLKLTDSFHRCTAFVVVDADAKHFCSQAPFDMESILAAAATQNQFEISRFGHELQRLGHLALIALI